jgi:hypothetical protein
MMLLTEQSWSPLSGKFPLIQNTNLFATGKTVLVNRSRQFQTAEQTAVHEYGTSKVFAVILPFD